MSASVRDARRPETRRSPRSTQLEAELLATGVADGDRAFNLTWHDWLNLRSQIEIVESDCACRAEAREFARRRISASDFPEPGRSGNLPFHRSCARRGGKFEITDAPGRVHHREARAKRCSRPRKRPRVRRHDPTLDPAANSRGADGEGGHRNPRGLSRRACGSAPTPRKAICPPSSSRPCWRIMKRQRKIAAPCAAIPAVRAGT